MMNAPIVTPVPPAKLIRVVFNPVLSYVLIAPSFIYAFSGTTNWVGRAKKA